MSDDQQTDPAAADATADATPAAAPGAGPDAAAAELREALADPELAGQVRDVLRHLGSAPFDPVGTPED